MDIEQTCCLLVIIELKALAVVALAAAEVETLAVIKLLCRLITGHAISSLLLVLSNIIYWLVNLS